MPFVIRYPSGTYRLTTPWRLPTKDLQKAKVFKRRCDAGNALRMDAPPCSASMSAARGGVGEVVEVILAEVRSFS